MLYGVVPVSLASQLDLARSAQTSIERVFQLCGNDEVCRTAFPQPAIEFDSLLRRLTETPARVSLDRPDGSSRAVVITDRAVRDLVQGMLGSARSVERLPLLIHHAYTRDYLPVARALVGDGPSPPPGAPRGVFLSLICSEAIPQIRPDEIDRLTQGTFFGDTPVRSQMQLCADWPRAPLPPDFWEPVRTSVPVLARPKMSLAHLHVGKQQVVTTLGLARGPDGTSAARGSGHYCPESGRAKKATSGG